VPLGRFNSGLFGVLFLADRETDQQGALYNALDERAGMHDSEEEASRLRSESAEAGGETIAGVERYEVRVFELSLSGAGEVERVYEQANRAEAEHV
jgi:hypothetical protein